MKVILIIKKVDFKVFYLKIYLNGCAGTDIDELKFVIKAYFFRLLRI